MKNYCKNHLIIAKHFEKLQWKISKDYQVYKFWTIVVKNVDKLLSKMLKNYCRKFWKIFVKYFEKLLLRNLENDEILFGPLSTVNKK